MVGRRRTGNSSAPSRSLELDEARTLRPVSMNVHNLEYSVNVKKTTRVLLQGMMLDVNPGELMGIMGPSGAGKSTLLDILAQVNHSGQVSGDILINGKRVHKKRFRGISGYVSQTDIFLPTLTVQQTLRMYADLKLPESMSDDMKSARVRAVMRELGLEKCCNTKMGNALIRGVSGGEKRRVSIAVALLSEPGLLFLDEPTSGLSATDAHRVMKVARRLATRGHTLICTIHQPRSNIFGMFDRLLLLAEGRVAYHGPATQALKFFSSLGYECPPLTNPADFIIDVITPGVPAPVGDSGESGAGVCDISTSTPPPPSATATATITSAASGQRPTENLYTKLLDNGANDRASVLCSVDIRNPDDVGGVDTWRQVVDAFPCYELTHNLKRDVQAGNASDTGGVESPSGLRDTVASGVSSFTWTEDGLNDVSEYATGPLTQLLVVLRRNLHNTILDPQRFATRFGSGVLMALMVGSIFWQISYETELTARAGALFFVVSFQALASWSVIPAFIDDATLFHTERAQACYRSLPYFVATVLSDIPVSTVCTIVFAIPTYFMVGFDPKPECVIFFLMVCLLQYEIGSAFCQSAALITGDAVTANALTAAGFGFFMLFAGFFRTVNALPAAWQWATNVSPWRFAFQSLLANEYYHRGEVHVAAHTYLVGKDAIADAFDIDHDLTWQYFGIQLVFWVVFRSISYLLLKYKKVAK